jgi:hypothetical protein
MVARIPRACHGEIDRQFRKSTSRLLQYCAAAAATELVPSGAELVTHGRRSPAVIDYVLVGSVARQRKTRRGTVASSPLLADSPFCVLSCAARLQSARAPLSLHLTADLQANYARFVERVRSSGTVWGLKCLKGWAICPSNERDCDVYAFWSEEAYAKRHCQEDWANYKPAAIALDSFLGNWLPGLERDGHLVGVQFNSDLAGLEVEPSKLAEDLSRSTPAS